MKNRWKKRKKERKEQKHKKFEEFNITMQVFNITQFSSVTQSCLTICDPVNHSTPGLPVHYQLPESTQTHVQWVDDAIQHLILCCPLFLLPSIFPSIRVFSNESALRMRWPKYCLYGLPVTVSASSHGNSQKHLIYWHNCSKFRKQRRKQCSVTGQAVENPR